jgi:hypothetical protein
MKRVVSKKESGKPKAFKAPGAAKAGVRVRMVSAKHLWAMKRKAQMRDRRLVAAGFVKPEAMLLVRPELLKGARIEWADAGLNDD